MLRRLARIFIYRDSFARILWHDKTLCKMLFLHAALVFNEVYDVLFL